ncbi:MAG: CAP domain-containing protein [bacterium]
MTGKDIVQMIFCLGGLNPFCQMGCAETTSNQGNTTPNGPLYAEGLTPELLGISQENPNPGVTENIPTDGGAQDGATALTDDFAMTPEMLALVNKARSVKRKCGDKDYEPVRPLTWSEKLAKAALNHAGDMADKDYYSHCGSKGNKIPASSKEEEEKKCPGLTRAEDRAKTAGYPTNFVGENIFIGPHTIEDAVDGWLKSAGHCANIMNPDYTEIGVGYARGWNTKMKYTSESPFGKAFLWAMSLGNSKLMAAN